MVTDELLNFLRSREFLWQEGHTAFATKEEADKEVANVYLSVLYNKNYFLFQSYYIYAWFVLYVFYWVLFSLVG